MNQPISGRSAPGRVFFASFLAAAAAALTWACSEDAAATAEASGGDGGVTVDATTTGSDAAIGLACGDAGGAPARALVVQGNGARNELVAVNLATRAVDGRLAYDGGFGVAAVDGTEPYLLDETNDTVTRLDAYQPWKAVASWDVHGDDGVDGGETTANPIGIVTPSCAKAYVLRYNRNRLAVIDQSQPAGGAPTKWIDLGALMQEGDTQHIEVTSAVYVAKHHRVYVLLGNVDLTLFDTSDYSLHCPTAALTPSIIAIDPDTDRIVSLGGTAPGGGIALPGYNPVNTSPLVYDPAGDRLLLLEAGCTEGRAMTRRQVDAVSLASGTAEKLLDLSTQDFPSGIAFVDDTHAAIAFYAAGRLWDPAQASLGAAIPDGIDTVAVDGRGGFVATRSAMLADGGTELEVVTFPGDGGAPESVVKAPFTSAGGYVSGLGAWPHR